jgi:Glutaredoxin and related proteins|tara:strand:+ start:1779 stop:2018 length:240 start_codon:yes stop_codon:yes gene_type:complete
MKRKILIYSTSWCQPCKLAKKLLQERGLDFQEIDIEEKGWSREDLFDITGGRTVPQVVINDDTIGGYDDLVRFDQEGKL